jgi:hypothetical protein
VGDALEGIRLEQHQIGVLTDGDGAPLRSRTQELGGVGRRGA